MEYALVLKGGTLVIPKYGQVRADVGVMEGKIAAIVGPGVNIKGKKEVDIDGLYVFPGVIEPHAHLGVGNGLEDYFSESRAAAFGGITTIISFLRKPEPYEQVFEDTKTYAEKNSVIDFSFHIVLMLDSHLQSIGRYVNQLGVTSFKFYLTYRGEDAKVMGFEGIDDGFMFDCFREIAKYSSAVAIVHAENIEIVHRQKKQLIAQGRDDLAAWAESRPDVAEAEGVNRALFFARSTGCPVNILHLTSKVGLNEIETFKNRFVQQETLEVNVEVCHPYLALTADNGLGKAAKVKPPLRSREDVEALWDGIKKGTITTIGSDHVPRGLDAKLGSIWSPVTGCAETSYLMPFLLSEGYHHRGLSLTKIAELTSYNPARVYRLFPRKGNIQVGADADLTIVDLNKEQVVENRHILSRAGYSVYQGRKLRGWPVMTIVRGQVVMEGGDIIEQPGWGRYIYR